MQSDEMGLGAGRGCFPWVLEAAGTSAKQIDNDEDKDDVIVIIIIIAIIIAILCFYCYC